MPHSRISLPDTQLRSIRSAIMGNDYVLHVGLPASYSEDSGRKYPVLYFMDANVGSAMTIQTYRTLSMMQEAQDMILVGIGYPTESVQEWADRRSRELVAAATGRDLTQAILEEIIPFVETEYRALDVRAYAGYSRGALFGLYVMLHATEAFGTYVLGAPAGLKVNWSQETPGPDEGTIFDQEAAYAAVHDDMRARVHFSYGDLDETISKEVTDEMIETLRRRAYPSLEIEVVRFAGETHMSGAGPWMSRYLRFVFQDPK